MSAASIAGDLVKETTTADFRRDVIAESANSLVLVDFWAPWCGPCRQLTPILEKVVLGAGGKVKLVKMNIDEYPEIAGQLGVRSIPAVFAFQGGQPVDGFMGALPESQIKSFIERLAGPSVDPKLELLEQAEFARGEGDAQTAAAIYAEILAEFPGDAKGVAGLASLLTEAGDLAGAKEALAQVDPSQKDDPALTAARTALELAEQAAKIGDLGELRRRIDANPSDHQAHYDLALALNAKGDRSAAADCLLESYRRDKHWNEDAARKQLLQFFEAWGPVDPDTLTARRKLSALLFS